MESISFWLCVTPILGVAETVIVQQLLFRWGRISFPTSIVAGALGGFILTCLITLEIIAFRPLAEQAAFFIMNAAISLGLSACYLIFLNLNMTSLRIRMLKELLRAPNGGLSLASVTAGYDTHEILERRLTRLIAKKQIRLDEGYYYAQGTWIPKIIRTIHFLRRIVLPV